jgi:hypothetical protein
LPRSFSDGENILVDHRSIQDARGPPEQVPSADVRLQLSANIQVRCLAAKNSPGDRNVALTREQKIAHVAVQPGSLDFSGSHFALINTDRHATTGNRFLNA